MTTKTLRKSYNVLAHLAEPPMPQAQQSFQKSSVPKLAHEVMQEALGALRVQEDMVGREVLAVLVKAGRMSRREP